MLPECTVTALSQPMVSLTLKVEPKSGELSGPRWRMSARLLVCCADMMPLHRTRCCDGRSHSLMAQKIVWHGLCTPHQTSMLGRGRVAWQPSGMRTSQLNPSASFLIIGFFRWCQGAHGVVVSHPLRMRKALGSNPSVSKSLHFWIIGSDLS